MLYKSLGSSCYPFRTFAGFDPEACGQSSCWPCGLHYYPLTHPSNLQLFCHTCGVWSPPLTSCDSLTHVHIVFLGVSRSPPLLLLFAIRPPRLLVGPQFLVGLHCRPSSSALDSTSTTSALLLFPFLNTLLALPVLSLFIMQFLAGLGYVGFSYLSKGTAPSSSSGEKSDDPLEEARRIMDKYK